MSSQEESASNFFEPCKTAAELHEFILKYLKIDLPWDIVDEDSTSSAMKFVWSVYRKMLTNKGPTRHVLAASRNTAKTLTCSIIQFLGMLHFRRDGNHISATLDQSAALVRYADKFMNIPELVPHKVTDNVKRKELFNLPPNSYTSKNHASLLVVTATKKGANSSRSSLLTFDEVDLTSEDILSEAAYIADPTSDGHKFDPLFIYLSSRKTNDGPIQHLMDLAAEVALPGKEKRIALHKWSSVDFMEKCPPDVYLPEDGEHLAYINTETLKTVWGKELFESTVPESLRSQYKTVSAYKGCMTCPAFISCQGRSVKQKGSSVMLRTRQFVGDIIDAVRDAAVIIAQTLNWKPETTGVVFKTFSRHKHVKDPIDFYKFVTGQAYNPLGLTPEELHRIELDGDPVYLSAITPTKDTIYKAMVDSGWTIGYGVDWGYSPDPATCLVIGWHKKRKTCVVLHYEKANNYANHIWAEYVCKTINKRFPTEYVAPDMSDPASPTYFAKHKVQSLDTKPPRIEPGVSFMRGLMWNPQTQSTSFAILDDSQEDNGNVHVMEAIEHWTHAKTITGKYDMDKFADNEWTHPIDSARYALNPFIEERQVTISVGQKPSTHSLVDSAALGNEEAIKIIEQKQELMTQVRDYFQNEHGISNATAKPEDVIKNKKTTGVRFKF